MINFTRRRVIALIIVIPAVLFPLGAFAQDVEQATRETDRSFREETEGKLKPAVPEEPEIERKEKEPEGAERAAFFIKRIELTGNESFPAEDFRPLIEKYEDKKTSLEELNLLAKEIEREYIKKGIIAACIIPPQDIKDGMMKLEVIESRMGVLDIKAHEHFKNQRLSYYWQLKPGEVIDYQKISRSLQHMSDNPDRSVKAVLHAGREPRTTDILLETETSLPAHFSYAMDREGSAPTGKLRQTYGVRHNNLAGFDDVFLGGYTFTAHSDAFYFFHRVPVTPFGTSLMYGYSYSQASPKKEYRINEITSRAHNGSLYVYQDLFNGDRHIGEVYGGLDVKNKTITINSMQTFSRDRLRIMRLGGNFVYRTSGSVTSVSPELSQGLNGLGACEKYDLASRGAENRFTKFNLGIEHKTNLPLDFQANIKCNGQLSFSGLTPQEQFSLGGINSVRGYPAGDYLADSACQINTELLIPAFFIPQEIKLPFDKKALRDEVTPLLFFDYGYGKKHETIGTDKNHDRLAGMGAGLRLFLYEHLLLRMEWGLPVAHDPITDSRGSFFHLSFDFEI